MRTPLNQLPPGIEDPRKTSRSTRLQQYQSTPCRIPGLFQNPRCIELRELVQDIGKHRQVVRFRSAVEATQVGVPPRRRGKSEFAGEGRPVRILLNKRCRRNGVEACLSRPERRPRTRAEIDHARGRARQFGENRRKRRESRRHPRQRVSGEISAPMEPDGQSLAVCIREPPGRSSQFSGRQGGGFAL